MSENNIQLTKEAFSRQSDVFDALYSGDSMIAYKRARVRNHVEKYLKPNARILELNAGTGEDAIYFASQGHQVHATDLSEKMLLQMKEKVEAEHLQNAIRMEPCSFMELHHLKNKGPYDLVFSNFAGLNCTEKLPEVLQQMESLIKPGGRLTMVIMPPFCLWETLLVFKGKFKTAFRRFNSKKGADAHVEGVHFKCWYYSPDAVKSALSGQFKHIITEGLCTIVPPSYITGFIEKYPTLFRVLSKWETRLAKHWPWRNIGDYYIITFEKA